MQAVHRLREPGVEIASIDDPAARELVFTGIHLGHYGVDFNRGRPKSDWVRLASLLAGVVRFNSPDLHAEASKVVEAGAHALAAEAAHFEELTALAAGALGANAHLVEAGADGLVLFNRFYQPDIDVEELQVRRQVHLSSSAELPLRITWLAMLSPKVKASLACTGGVHTVRHCRIGFRLA